jgi:hypothetical protein
MLSVNFFCNISSYDILAYIKKELYSVHILYENSTSTMPVSRGKVGFSAVCQAMYS